MRTLINMNQNRTQQYTTLAIITGVACAGLCGSVTHAQQAALATPKPPGWETSAAAGVTLTRGNSDTLLATLTLDTKRKWEKDEFLAGIAGGYGENNQIKNTEFLKGYAQYNHLFTERFYGGVRLDALYDSIANLDHRVTLSPLVGYYLIKEAK